MTWESILMDGEKIVKNKGLNPHYRSFSLGKAWNSCKKWNFGQDFSEEIKVPISSLGNGNNVNTNLYLDREVKGKGMGEIEQASASSAPAAGLRIPRSGTGEGPGGPAGGAIRQPNPNL